jgi:hypothetical protein
MIGVLDFTRYLQKNPVFEKVRDFRSYCTGKVSPNLTALLLSEHAVGVEGNGGVHILSLSLISISVSAERISIIFSCVDATQQL